MQFSLGFIDKIRTMRSEKSKRIQQILKPELGLIPNEEKVFEHIGLEREEKFGFAETSNISLNSYDSKPLEIVHSTPDGLILDCGAGYRAEYFHNVVNYEIVPYSTTDVLGFAEDLPFEDNSFDAVFSFAVLEHVKYPDIVASELSRVLKPGGKLVVSAAFLQPTHGYPHHYFNMTNLGLKSLFEENIDIQEQFINNGTSPVVSLSWFLGEWMRDLPKSTQKKFGKIKIADFVKNPPRKFFQEPFVRELTEETNFKLACAIKMLGTKKIK